MPLGRPSPLLDCTTKTSNERPCSHVPIVHPRVTERCQLALMTTVVDELDVGAREIPGHSPPGFTQALW